MKLCWSQLHCAITFHTPSEKSYHVSGCYHSNATLLIGHKFTGLRYYNARYYDPELGQFISPDTLVPDPGQLLDYNCYAYARANPMRYNDPTGHDPGAWMALGGAPSLAVGDQVDRVLLKCSPCQR